MIKHRLNFTHFKNSKEYSLFRKRYVVNKITPKIEINNKQLSSFARKVKRRAPMGPVIIFSVRTYNNVILTAGNADLDPLLWVTPVSCGMKKAYRKKRTSPYTAQKIGTEMGRRLLARGYRTLFALFRGPKPHAHTRTVRGALKAQGKRILIPGGILSRTQRPYYIRIHLILAVIVGLDMTNPHNGCRPKKRRKKRVKYPQLQTKRWYPRRKDNHRARWYHICYRKTARFRNFLVKDRVGPTWFKNPHLYSHHRQYWYIMTTITRTQIERWKYQHQRKNLQWKVQKIKELKENTNQ